MVALAESAGLRTLAPDHLSVPTDKGAKAGLKVTSLVAGRWPASTASTTRDCCDTAAWAGCSTRAYAPSTLGSFLRAFTFGHVRQLDAVASRFLTRLTDWAPLLNAPGTDDHVLADIDDTIVEVHGHAKQGAGFG